MITPLLKNRYRVIETIGFGGFGETFLAEDTQLPSGRRCVIKKLKPLETDDPEIYRLVHEMFQKEAVTLEQLGKNCNQIPELYAYFSENGQFYLVQEYVEGQTLTQKLQHQGLLSEAEVKELLINVLNILNYVHNKQIIHRDIKPDNIIIRHADGKPVLIDFGAVKEKIGNTITASGTPIKSKIVGTPGSMPSEQLLGHPVFNSDLYSLGLTAIYLLTGKMPNELSTDATGDKFLWQHHAFDISPDFVMLLDKATAYHQHYRYSSASDMLAALQVGTNSSPTVPITPAYSPNKTSGMGDLQKAVITGVIFSLCFTTALWAKEQILPSRQTVVTPPTPSIPQPSPKPSTPTLEQSEKPPSKTQRQAPSSSAVLRQTSSITRKKAVTLINRWQDAKPELFAFPFNRELGAELTTGEAYDKNFGQDGSQKWLKNNNAYYSYGKQSIDSIEKFFADGNQATIDAIVTEERKFYKNGSLSSGENTGSDTRLVRYSLELENNQLKISDYKTLKVISEKQVPVVPSVSTSTPQITQKEALDVITRWQEVKEEIFGPHYNRQLADEITTGEAYKNNIGSNSSLQWLIENNAYYRYGVQKIDSVEKFVVNQDQATIELVITEDRRFYKDGKLITGENTAFDTRLVRYSLQRSNGQLKISDYSTVKIINSR